MRAAPNASRTPPEDAAPREDVEVPALALCVVCGLSDCQGCARESARATAGTPWEEPEGSALGRLWRTAHVATVDGESFFGELPDGSVGKALSFAISCELCAIASLLVMWVPLAYACVPELVVSIAHDTARRGTLLVALCLAVPLLSVSMVALHVVWGGSLELGLRLSGAPPRAAHSLRYALYSCGWDLVTSPFGFAAGWVSSGLRGAAQEMGAALRIPRSATRAYLGRARDVSDKKARRALTTAVVVTGSVVIAGALGLGAAIVVALT